MKKLNLLSIIIVMTVIYFINVTSITAATPTSAAPANTSADPSASSTGTLEKIKEMVAEKVAKLKLVEKRGISGTVQESANTQITLKDRKGDSRIIEIDELTKFQDSANKSFGISDVNKGEILAVIGVYNKDTKRLLARYVNRTKTPLVIFDGIITSKDKVNYTVTAANELGETKTIDIQSSTKSQNYTKADGLTKSGFTKINSGERILVSGYTDLKDSNKLIASRLIHFTDILPSTKMKAIEQNTKPKAE